MMRKRIALFLPALVVTGCVTRPPQRAGQGRFVDLYAEVPPAEARTLLDMSDAHVERVAAWLGVPPPRDRARLCVFSSRLGLWRFLNEHCPEQRWSRGVCFEEDGGYVIAVHLPATADPTRRTRHEVTHYALAANFHYLPPWADEGLAEFFSVTGPTGRVNDSDLDLGSLDRGLRGSAKPRLRSLVTTAPGERLTREQYAEAWGLVYFLLRRDAAGAVAMRRYLERVLPGADPAQSFEQSFGASPDRMERPWRDFILRLAGERASP